MGSRERRRVRVVALISAIVICVTAGIVAFLLHSLVDFNMHIPANALMCCLLVTIAVVLAQHVDDDFGAADRR